MIPNHFDLILSVVLMGILFLRHLKVHEDRSKINYTPLVTAVGVLGGLIHLIAYADSGSLIETLKQSLVIVGTGVFLSAIMGIMNQTSSMNINRSAQADYVSLRENLDKLSVSFTTLAAKIENIGELENNTNDHLKTFFKAETQSWEAANANQKLFVSKIESLMLKQQEISEKFEEFTLTELPGLDNVIHRHIDLLRIAETDHFNQLKSISKNSCEGFQELTETLLSLKKRLETLGHQQISENAVHHFEKEIGRIIAHFEKQIFLLGTKSESMVTSMMEHDSLLHGAREQSELIMQQMVLSSKQMKEITAASKELSESLKPISKLFVAAETLHQEFRNAKGELSELISVLQDNANRENIDFSDAFKELATQLETRLSSLGSTVPQHSIRTDEATNIQELSSRVKLQKSYLGEE